MATGGLEGQSVGDGSGSSLAGGGGDGSGGAEFFGIGGKGGSFVYVVDASGSMNEEGKWERARAELLRSIEHLTEGQRFFIIFYNDGWYPMSADKPVLATRQTDRSHAALGEPRLAGRRHVPARSAAARTVDGTGRGLLSLRRTVRPGSDRSRCECENPSSTAQIPIHTIAFVNKETIDLMQQIAKQSGGKFRFVQ